MTFDAVTFDDTARAALDSIKDRGLPATPENYAVWYAYHSGENPNLNRALDISVSSNREIDDELMADLHLQFIGSEKQSQVVNEASAKLELVVNNVMDRMQTANDDAGEFGSALENFSDGLDETDEVRVQSLVASILSETRKIEAQNTRLQDELESYSNEVSKLREDLEFVRQEARTDALTGLANRKYFDTFINAAIRDAVETGEALTLLMGDVDHFKSFNDTYGHQLGDQVLKVVSNILSENSKGRDLAARYGGEEFCVVLPDTTIENAVIVANQMRSRVAAKKIVRKKTGEELRQITMSLGVAMFRYGEPSADLIGRADEALYWAKQNGRNLVGSETDVEQSKKP
jgi:diguanylate cyclase